MKLLIAVIAESQNDYKNYFDNWRNKELEFYYVSDRNQIRGIHFDGVVITKKAKYSYLKRELYCELANDTFLNISKGVLSIRLM